MPIETQNVSIELLNTMFVDKCYSGQIKEAQEQASLYVRTRMYEDGILRRLFEFRQLTAAELDPEMDTDKPSIICEIEPNASKATFVPFKGTGDRQYFTGKRFRVPFGKVEAERVSKSKFELMTIRMPITDWIKENQVKMIQQEEDKYFLDTVQAILTDAASTQTATIAAGASNFKEAFLTGIKGLNTLKVPAGKVLMNKNTYVDSLKLKVEDIGFKAQDDRYSRGVDGEDSFLGYPVVTTIKDDLVKENEIYFFSTQEYFMKFMMLQDATLFLKTEADMIEFHTYEAPGIGIGNTKGVFKVTMA